MGFFSTPLDAALSSTSKIRLLRLFVEQDRTLSAREASRLVGMSMPAVLRAINDLAELGLIIREQSGRQYLCRANYAHKLMELALIPLFSIESQWPEMLFRAVREMLAFEAEQVNGHSGSQVMPRSPVIAAWIFGSVARGEDKPGSDLDLFVLTHSAQAADRISEHLADAASRWVETFGTDLRPIVMPLDKALHQYDRGSPLIRNAVKHARVVVGEVPERLRDG